VPLTAPGTDGGVLTDGEGNMLIGWQEIDKEGNPVGDVMTVNYTIKNEFNIADPDLRLTRIVKPPLK